MPNSILVWVWILHAFAAIFLVVAVAAVAHQLTRNWTGPEGRRHRSFVFVALIAGFALCRLLELVLPYWVQVTHYLAGLVQL
jgi:hypothetical protein